MDRPFAVVLDNYYQWVLNKTNPPGSADEKLTYFPRFHRAPFGIQWNLNWYSTLADKTGLTAEEELKTILERRRIPASYSSYNNELDGIRQVIEGAEALTENLVKVENYKELVYKERTCLEYCRSRLSKDDFREEINRCEDNCVLPRSLVHEDVTAKLENWRTQAVSCMTSHSSEQGDGNNTKFNQCLVDYNDSLKTYGTSRENLNTWIQNYSKYFTTENFTRKISNK